MRPGLLATSQCFLGSSTLVLLLTPTLKELIMKMTTMMWRNLALLCLTAFTSLTAMAQLATLHGNLSGYNNLSQMAMKMPGGMSSNAGTEQASLPSAQMSVQTSALDKMSQRASYKQYRKRASMNALQVAQQPTSYVGGTTINNSTLVGASTVTNSGNVTVSPVFKFQGMGSQPALASSTLSPQPATAGVQTATAQPVYATQPATAVNTPSAIEVVNAQTSAQKELAAIQLQNQKELAKDQRKCAVLSTVGSIAGGALAGMYSWGIGTGGGAAAGGALGALACQT